MAVSSGFPSRSAMRSARMLSGASSQILMSASSAASHPASLEEDVVALLGEVVQPPVEVAVDLVVLLGQFVELHGREPALLRERPEDVPARDVVELERLRERGGGRALPAPGGSGDGE
jgi:hypothetical protein